MSTISEALKELKQVKQVNLKKITVKESLNEADEKDEWRLLPTFEDVMEFSRDTKWVFGILKGDSARPYYDIFTRNAKFYGKGVGADRQLKTVTTEGKVFGPFDVNDHKVVDESLNEDVDSSIPVTFLGANTVCDYVLNNVKRGSYIHVGYFSELKPAAQYRGGRGSEGNPYVRIFKANEYYGRCGIDYESRKEVKDYREITGAERGSSWYTIDDNSKLFTSKANGEKGIVMYQQPGTKVRTKFFISLDNEDLHEATRDEVAKYMTSGDAAKLITPPSVAKTYTDAEGNIHTIEQQPNALYASKIYYIGTESHGKLGNPII